MGIDVTDAIGDAVDRFTTPTGAVLAGVFVAFGLMEAVIKETAFGAFLEWAIDTLGADVAQFMGYDVSASDVSVQRLQQELVERDLAMVAMELEELTSAGLDLSLPVALLFLAVLPFVAEFIQVVAVRAIAHEPETMPTGAVLEDVGSVYVRSLLSNFVAWVLVGIGLLIAVIPGLVLAVIFLFVRQRVVLGGDGIFEALGSSYGTFKRNLVPVLVLFLLVLPLGIVATWGLGMLGLPWWLYTTLSSIVVAFTIVLVTSAYLQTEGATDAFPPAEDAAG